MTKKRFKRYLFDGGFWFDNDYVEPIWAIGDTIDKDNPICYLEFKDEYKDLCDEVVDFLNKFCEENEYLKLENKALKYVLENYKQIDVEVVLDD